MTVNYERKKIWCEITSLDNVITELQFYRDQYGANTRIQEMGIYGSDDSYYAVMCARDETDEEMTKRIAQEEKWAAEKKVRDLEQLERLKKQYGVG